MFADDFFSVCPRLSLRNFFAVEIVRVTSEKGAFFDFNSDACPSINHFSWGNHSPIIAFGLAVGATQQHIKEAAVVCKLVSVP